MHNVDLRCEHLAGVLNVKPDGLSRGWEDAQTADFMLHSEDFATLNEEPHDVDAACDKGGHTAQPGCALTFAPGERSFIRNFAEAAGRRIWCFPPFAAVADFIWAVERAHDIDQATSCTMLVPEFATEAWFRRAVRGRKRPVWRERERIRAVDARLWQGEATRARDFPHRPRRIWSGLSVDLLVIEFP